MAAPDLPPDGALASLLRTLAESLDVREIFARISPEARRIVPHDFLMLGLLSDDHHRVRVIALSGAARHVGRRRAVGHAAGRGLGWFTPYYADVGTGSSRVTCQVFAGVGYHYKWGDVMVGYRHLAYEFKSGQPVSDAAFGGPVVGVAFRF